MNGLDFVHCVRYSVQCKWSCWFHKFSYIFELQTKFCPWLYLKTYMIAILFPTYFSSETTFYVYLFPYMLVMFNLREWANYGSHKVQHMYSTALSIMQPFIWFLIAHTEKRKITVTIWNKGNASKFLLKCKFWDSYYTSSLFLFTVNNIGS